MDFNIVLENIEYIMGTMFSPVFDVYDEDEEKYYTSEIIVELSNGLSKSKNYDIIEKILKQYIEDLSIGIANLINIFEPEAIGIGGSFVYFSDVLLDRLIQNIIKKQYLFNKREELIIIPAALGNDAGIIGSVL